MPDSQIEVDRTVRASLLFLASMALIALLYFTRGLLAPFALAIFVWLIIDAFARWLDGLSSKIPYWLALSVALLTVLLLFAGVIVVIVDTVGDVIHDAPQYQERFKEIAAWLAEVTGRDNLSFAALNDRFGLSGKIQTGLTAFAATVQGVVSEFALIALYVAFLFMAQSTFPMKIDKLFSDGKSREQARKTGEKIRHSIERYLSVQTIISLMQTVISYIGMSALGLDNALFWALVIFILNYIPIVGGFAAVVFPCLFALVQFDSIGRVAGLVGILVGAQFVIGNTIQPKMMGDSMNLSALVVVLSLSIWGALWGGVGAFLSAPLTVIIMIILAQFPATRWISILLSADGNPDFDGKKEPSKGDDEDDPDAGPVPSM